jgi:hypothetical protein
MLLFINTVIIKLFYSVCFVWKNRYKYYLKRTLTLQKLIRKRWSMIKKWVGVNSDLHRCRVTQSSRKEPFSTSESVCTIQDRELKGTKRYQKKTSSNSMPFIPDFRENEHLSAYNTAVCIWMYMGLHFRLWLGPLGPMMSSLLLKIRRKSVPSVTHLRHKHLNLDKN